MKRPLIALLFLSACDPLALGDGATPVLGDTARCTVEATCAGPLGDVPGAPCSVLVTDAAGERRYDSAAEITTDEAGWTIALRTYAEVPVWPGATWRVLDDGSDPGPGWMEPGFDDSAWAQVAAPLSNDAPPVTTFLRLSLDVHAREAITGASLGLMRDDGAAVYLNGVEILRDNLAPAAQPHTWATLPATDLSWVMAEIEADLLAQYTNVLAVEVHQSALAPEDFAFDLWLAASGDVASADLTGSGRESDVWRAEPGGSCDVTLDGVPQGAWHLSPR